MDIEKIKQKMQVLLGLVKQEFITAKLKDGSEVSFDALEINREVYNSEGNPLTEGEYELESGEKLIVDENGVIKEIVNPETNEEVKEEVVEEQMACGEKKEKMEDTPMEEVQEEVQENVEDEKYKELESRIANFESALSDLYNLVLTISEKIKNGEENIETISQEFKAFKAQPSAQPLHFNSVYESNETKSQAQLRLEKINKILNK